MHRELRAAVERLSVRDAFLITGAAAHDLYHAGQILLLERLMKE